MRMLRDEPEDFSLGEPFCRLSHREPETITLDCSVGCLQFVLSEKALRPLERAACASFIPPLTVRDVVELHQRGRLKEIRGLGPRRIGEIEVSLIYIGVMRR